MFFPMESEDAYSAEMLLSQISWPTYDDDEEEEEYPAETTQHITGYLKQYIDAASSKELKDLLNFWVGWEVVKENLAVVNLVVRGDLPRSSTCFCILPLPGHYKESLLQNGPD
ncbi:uncharacterized protein LOC131356035 [Hemibagrus wyckioides]|uniref:uncharacterized protein LOC131356035 n=1 Tax=Hemibagrus wyckioides TaxID=337641 RepID=UPI00266C584C|nr:uncharacterized protein LOC131356035 [Hemibagrus wyckioides]